MNALRALAAWLARVPPVIAALCACAWYALLWQLSSGPVPAPGSGLSGEVIANWLHAPVYGVLALACLLALPRVYNAWRVSWKGAVLVVGLCALAGLIDEWHQHHVPGRDASLPDLLTDVLGALGTVWSVDGVLRCARGAPWRMLLSLLASVLGAALATLLPRLWPDLWWL